MDRTSTARSKLRAATAADHERVDAVFAKLNLGDQTDYTAFLLAQAKAFLPVEAGLDASPLDRVLSDWPARRRSQLLIADLTALGVVCGPTADAPAFDSVEAALGGAYVLEGSRLGGRMLARSVAEGAPRSFLEAGDPGMWRDLIALLDATLISEAQLKGAIQAARAVFARFEASARSHRKGVS